MLNIPDPWVAAALLLCLASTLLCVVWGVFRWNEDDRDPETDEDLRRWAREEDKVEQDL